MTVLAVMFLFASLMAQWIKNLSALKETQETQVQSPGQEYPLEEEMATHSSVLAWRIPGKEELGGLLSMGLQSWTRLKRVSSSSRQVHGK